MRSLLFFLAFATTTAALAQEPVAEAKFHEGSRFYINGNREAALASVKQGLNTEPGNPKLNQLKKLLEEDKKKQEQEKKDKEQKEKQDKKNQDKQNKEQKEKEQKDKEDKENKDNKEKEDKEKKDKDQKEKKEQQQEEKKDSKEKKEEVPPSVSEKLKEMQMSEDKAKMILEAMKNQEVQYLQQNKRKATKPKDKGKPDW
jgi:outer membrane biosynthesis protein TonB